MLFFESVPIGTAILGGALIASIILGILIRTYEGKLSETSKRTRLGFLLVLASVVGFTIYIWILLGSLLRISPLVLPGFVSLLIYTIFVSLLFGGMCLVCGTNQKKKW